MLVFARGLCDWRQNYSTDSLTRRIFFNSGGKNSTAAWLVIGRLRRHRIWRSKSIKFDSAGAYQPLYAVSMIKVQNLGLFKSIQSLQNRFAFTPWLYILPSLERMLCDDLVTDVNVRKLFYEGRSINKLQNSVILLVFQI